MRIGLLWILVWLDNFCNDLLMQHPLPSSTICCTYIRLFINFTISSHFFLMSCLAFAGAVPWACIFAYIGGSGSKNIPNFVFGILAAYLIMFNIFPINMVLQYLRVSYWSDNYWGYQKGGYYFGEIIYQVLSLVAKSLLLWLVYGGSNQPNPGY